MQNHAELSWTDRDLSHEQFSTPALPKERQIRRLPAPTRGQVYRPASGTGSTEPVEFTGRGASASTSSVLGDVLPLASTYCGTWANNLVFEWPDDETFDAANRFSSTPSECFWVSTAQPPGSLPGLTHADSIKRLSQALHQILQQEPVLDGFDHPGERILQQLFNDYATESSKWIKTLLSASDETPHKADILKLLCRFKPKTPNWRRDIIAIALQSPSIEVRDAAIQAIESWAEPELVDVLRSHSERVPWLAEYARQSLRDLEGPQ